MCIAYTKFFLDLRDNFRRTVDPIIRHLRVVALIVELLSPWKFRNSSRNLKTEAWILDP